LLVPLNHALVPIFVFYNSTDTCSPGVTCTLSVSSSEPTAQRGDNTSPDWIVVSDHLVFLRAERVGRTGRVYTITVKCTDSAGNTTLKTTQVRVLPLSKSGARS
jgi:hypothetical protein